MGPDGARVTQLSTSALEIESVLSDTIGGQHLHAGADLINSLAQPGSTTTVQQRQTANQVQETTANKVTLEVDSREANKSFSLPFPLHSITEPTTYSNVHKLASGTSIDDQEWLDWMASELKKSLAKFADKQSRREFPNNRANSNIVPIISLLAGELSSVLDANFDDTANNSPSLANTSTANAGSVAGSAISAASLISPEVANKFNDKHWQREKLLQVLQQNKLVLYTCGASNTHSSNKLLSLDDNELGDKLAKVRPLFKSILVKPNGKLLYP